MPRLTALTALVALLPLMSAVVPAQAAAPACAAKLSKDAKTIYDATLPKVTAGANLRDLVTETTRSLAMSGKISSSTARDSATAAGQCLQQPSS